MNSERNISIVIQLLSSAI